MEAFPIKELVTVTLLVEMLGRIWARQPSGLGARSESGLTGHTHTYTHTHPLPTLSPFSAHPRWPGTCHVSFPSPRTSDESWGEVGGAPWS